jgi:diadenosine tetraphosphate (Ap4A) HIT family hydrolase
MPSIFTRIISGELPARFVYQDEQCVAFLTQGPIRHGHTLLVPRREIDHWLDLPPELMQHLMLVGQRIGKAIQRFAKSEKVALIIAGLEVRHAHLHLIPIDTLQDLDFTRQEKNPDPVAMDAAADAIRQGI